MSFKDFEKRATKAAFKPGQTHQRQPVKALKEGKGMPERTKPKAEAVKHDGPREFTERQMVRAKAAKG